MKSGVNKEGSSMTFAASIINCFYPQQLTIKLVLKLLEGGRYEQNNQEFAVSQPGGDFKKNQGNRWFLEGPEVAGYLERFGGSSSGEGNCGAYWTGTANCAQPDLPI
jgi:hypothetical protein